MTEISVLELKPIQISINEIKLIKMEEMEAKVLTRRVDLIKDLVLGYYKQSWNQIDNRIRKREIVQSRHLLIYFFRHKLNFGLKQIGRMFAEARDHSTIIHSIQVVKDLYDSDVEFRNDFEKLNELIDYELNR